MNIKILSVITVILLGVTSINALAVDSEDKPQVEISTKNDSYLFSDAVIKTTDTYASVTLDGSDSFLREPGKPMLPVCTKTFTFPLGTK